MKSKLREEFDLELIWSFLKYIWVGLLISHLSLNIDLGDTKTKGKKDIYA